MNLNQIKYFLVAAQCLSFTKAANQLYITQPALSRQIQMMEEELGVILFLRTSRKMQLTPAGVILKERFKNIYDDYNLAVAKARSAYQGLSGELNVGILEGTYVGDLFPNVLQYFSDHYPNVDVRINSYSFGNLIDGINSGELDVIITLKFDIENLADVLAFYLHDGDAVRLVYCDGLGVATVKIGLESGVTHFFVCATAA